MRFAFLIPPLMLLAACGQGEDKKDGPEIKINAGGADGGVQITAGEGGGKVAARRPRSAPPPFPPHPPAPASPRRRAGRRRPGAPRTGAR